MASTIEEIFSGYGSTPLSLSEQQKQNIYSSIGYAPGSQLKQKQLNQLRTKLKKGKLGISGDPTDILASAFSASSFSNPKVQKQFQKQTQKKGYTELGGQYIKPLGEEALRKAGGLGFAAEDVRKSVAGKFAAGQVTEQIRRFMGDEYKTDPKTGRFVSNVPIEIKDGSKKDESPFTSSVTNFKSFLEGLNPDALPGYTPGEIEYATQIDPYKIQAKSAKELAKIQQGTSLYGLIPAGIL